MQQGRALSFRERWQVSAANVGRPSTLALLATLPPAADEVVTRAKLVDALAYLMELYPLLKCGIIHGRTQEPSFRVQRELKPGQALECRPEAGHSADEELLAELCNMGTTFSGTSGPLWRIVCYPGSRLRIGLSVAHVLADGLGARNLFCDFLSLLREPLIGSPLAVYPLAPTWDSSADLRVTLRAVLAHKLQALLSKITTLIFSPSRLVPSCAPNERSPTRCALLSFGADETAALKAFARAHSIGTLHPLLQGAAIAATISAADEPVHGGRVSVATPISFRDERAGHPRATGNYAGGVQSTFNLSAQHTFVEVCRSYARTLNGSQVRKKARQTTNLLEALLPAVHPAGQSFTLDGKLYPLTALDKRLRDMQLSSQRPEVDVRISNLMRMDRTGWEECGELSLAAAQSAGVSFTPLTLTVVSAADGSMSIVLSYQRVSSKSDAYYKTYMNELRILLERVADGGVNGQTTLGELGECAHSVLEKGSLTSSSSTVGPIQSQTRSSSHTRSRAPQSPKQPAPR